MIRYTDLCLTQIVSFKFHNSGFKLVVEYCRSRKKESFEYLMNLLPDGEWVFIDKVNDDENLNTKEKNAGTEKHNSQKSSVWRSEKYHIEFMGVRKIWSRYTRNLKSLF